MNTQSQPLAAGQAAHTQFPLGACMSAGDRSATIYETDHHASRVSVRITNELYPEINPQYSATVRACNSHAQLVEALERAHSDLQRIFQHPNANAAGVGESNIASLAYAAGARIRSALQSATK